jgi:Ca2+/Na+ antiporter
MHITENKKVGFWALWCAIAIALMVIGAIMGDKVNKFKKESKKNKTTEEYKGLSLGYSFLMFIIGLIMIIVTILVYLWNQYRREKY